MLLAVCGFNVKFIGSAWTFSGESTNGLFYKPECLTVPPGPAPFPTSNDPKFFDYKCYFYELSVMLAKGESAVSVSDE